MCVAQKKAFGDVDDFTPKGGIKAMGDAMGRGMVLTMSLWDDDEVHMIWLDAVDPIPPKGEKPKPGALRGTCSPTSGDPKVVQKEHPNAYVVYSDVKFGEIGSTIAA